MFEIEGLIPDVFAGNRGLDSCCPGDAAGFEAEGGAVSGVVWLEISQQQQQQKDLTLLKHIS